MKIEDIKPGISGIYKIIFNNDKIYIGLSNDIRRRMIEHIKKDLREHPDLKISQAIIKHGIKDIKIIEEIAPNDRARLKEREKYWIGFYDSFVSHGKGYNMTLGGDGASEGIHNVASYLSQDRLEKIYDLLLNSDYTYNEIAELTQSTYKIIADINKGAHYRNENFSYPLRESRIEREGLKNKHSLFYGKEEQLLNLIKDLKENLLSYDDLCKKYSIRKEIVSKVNQGRQYSMPGESYPLRPVDKGKATRRIFSEEEMISIKEMLENPNISMKEISKIISCDSKVISAINKGERQNNPEWDYPLRKKKMKTGPKPYSS